MAQEPGIRSIFISYRRQDAPGEAGRLCDDLRRTFGDQNVFMDVEGSISAGADFRHAITQNVADCAIFLAVIGPHWSTLTDSQGKPRINKEDDWVRLEIASGLSQQKRVIPVLVNGATMPDASTLPADIKDMAYREGVELTNTRWSNDVSGFVKTLKRHVPAGAAGTAEDGKRPAWRRSWVAIGLVVLLAVLLAVRLWPADHTQEVTAAVRQWAAALDTNDPDQIARCYAGTVAPYFVYPSATNQRIRQEYATLFGPDSHGTRNHLSDAVVTDLHVANASGTTVNADFVKHLNTVQSNVKAPGAVKLSTQTKQMHFTYQKIAGEWKIVGETQAEVLKP